jgi:predicted nucleotidyltransferase
MELPPSFLAFPAHRRIAERILEELVRDERVLGIYLSGSFARGNPDTYSDLDFNILVPSDMREAIKNEHARLREHVGEVVCDFPAIHLGDPNQLITFYREDYPVHVDYQYRIPHELAPAAINRYVAILLDKTGELQAWKDKCDSTEESCTPTQGQLQYFEERFWGWCVYTDGKIKRGELWEARDAMEYLRNNVLVRLAYFAEALRPEGNRRLENKFPKQILDSLEATLQCGHSREDYGETLLAIAACYIALMDRTAAQFNIVIQQKDREYFRRFLSH